MNEKNEIDQRQLCLLVNYFKVHYKALEVMCTEAIDTLDNTLKGVCCFGCKEDFEYEINDPQFAKLKIELEKELSKLVSEEQLDNCEDSNILWGSCKYTYNRILEKLEEWSSKYGATINVLSESDPNFTWYLAYVEKARKRSQRSRAKTVNSRGIKNKTYSNKKISASRNNSMEPLKRGNFRTSGNHFYYKDFRILAEPFLLDILYELMENRSSKLELNELLSRINQNSDKEEISLITFKKYPSRLNQEINKSINNGSTLGKNKKIVFVKDGICNLDINL